MVREKIGTIKESERAVPVVGKADIVVAGGGPAGLTAAVAAARQEVSVLLIERYGFLGGMGTAGMVTAWNNWAPKPDAVEIKGIYREIVNRLFERGGAIASMESPMQYFIDPEVLKIVLDKMVEESGVQLLLHTLVVDSIKEGAAVTGVIIENKSGRGAVLGERIIDCTGDGDVFASAGVLFEKGRKKDGLTQPGSLMFRIGNVNIDELERYIHEHPEEMFADPAATDQSASEEISPRIGPMVKRSHLSPGKGRMYVGFPEVMRKSIKDGYSIPTNRIVFNTTPRKGEACFNLSRVPLDSTKAEDLTRAELEGRKQVQELVEVLKKYMPGFESCYLVDTATQIGLRESRRMKGVYMLTKDDVLSGRKFEDVITTVYNAGIDIHEPSGKGFTLIPCTKPIHIPYRCLLPKEVEGLLVAGRCISLTHEALATSRAQHKVMAIGQAAGTAAALSQRHKVPLRKIDVPELQKCLRDQGLNFG